MDDTRPQARPRHHADKYAPKIYDKTEQLHSRAATMLNQEANGPAGGFDNTPFPPFPSGHTLKFTFHRGINLPCADFGRFSSDPYILAQLMVDLPQRHKQDPTFTFRTPTIRKNRDPIWESEWVVANIPSSGFKLKCAVFDEDAADHDDKLGNAYVDVDAIDEKWSGFKEQSFKIKKHTGSKRVYLFGNVAALASGRLDVGSHIVVSVEYLERTPGDRGAQMYTVGPNYWFKHFSPLIGRLAGTKMEQKNGGKTITRYNFQATQIQLRGPVPPQLYHRYVEFRPFVAGMFTSQSLRGRILNRALHHQHERIYNFDRTTLHDQFEWPCIELTQKFLEFTHHAQGGRIFTYVLTLDGQMRFTETGKEFGIDLLSKHTMHSNVSIYIAYSGEFFLRRRKLLHRNSEHDIPVEESHASHEETEVSTDPNDYELFIDNDSGTYRPNGQCLPLLKEFLSSNFLGLHITTLDCQDDAEKMGELKNEQREFKKRETGQMTFLQRSSTSSLGISSSDEEDLDEMAHPKKRGELSQRVHDMRDVKGRVMKWAATDRDPNVADNAQLKSTALEDVNTKSTPDMDNRPQTAL